MSFHAPNKYRVRNGLLRTTDADGNCGLFFVPSRPGKAPLKVIASDDAAEAGGMAWEHVSVSLPDRCPTWEEMCKIKSLFWDDEDAVAQFHPPRSEWVNNHSYCLHMWRPVGVQMPMPPSIMVGVKEAGVLV